MRRMMIIAVTQFRTRRCDDHATVHLTPAVRGWPLQLSSSSIPRQYQHIRLSHACTRPGLVDANSVELPAAELTSLLPAAAAARPGGTGHTGRDRVARDSDPGPAPGGGTARRRIKLNSMPPRHFHGSYECIWPVSKMC